MNHAASHTSSWEAMVYVFLTSILEDEHQMRAYIADKKPLVMTPEDWEKHKNATECHIYNKRQVKDLFLGSITVHDRDTGRYCGQSHRRSHYETLRKIKFIGAQRERKARDEIDQWIANNQETCLCFSQLSFLCTSLILLANYQRSLIRFLSKHLVNIM